MLWFPQQLESRQELMQGSAEARRGTVLGGTITAVPSGLAISESLKISIQVGISLALAFPCLLLKRGI